ncbi:unnamed protein product [Phytophthora fragariaefolia]|uniref:Unnamed protein product n=1 Tax=Phytophthora fragariaefolia TaxID=1490495 RepID=A0A9W6XJD0_9STRA|nr:unnamed protein product [Phytophthora fragariaefolia]
MNDTLPDIKALFKSKLRLNMTEGDVEARVLDYFNCFGQIMRANGLTECFEGEAGRRDQCERLIASLHPAALKAEVKMCIRFSHKPAASDPRLLYELIVDKATEHERQFQRLKLEKRGKSEKRDRAGCDDPQPDKDRLRKDNKKLRGSKLRNPQAAETTRTASETKLLAKTAKLPPSPCPKCKEMHRIRDCPKVTTEAEKDALRKTLRDQAKTKLYRLKRLGEILPMSGREVTVNGAERLDNPVRNQAYGSIWVTADKKVKLHLLIHTAAGPVEPVSVVDVLIADVDYNEFIVGNDLLLSLGIDVDRQLEMLADRGSDETSGDNIELEADEPPVAATSSSDDDIFAAVERLLDRSVENGFPVDRLETLRTIAHAFDVWHLELRDDPPAREPPTKMRLREGARPVKCKPRKYPPHIRQFLGEFNSRLVALGLVYENPDSRWVSPVLPVKKSADLMDLRQTTDYRAVNELADVRAAVMPILSLAVKHARGMNHFGVFDFPKGFLATSPG